MDDRTKFLISTVIATVLVLIIVGALILDIVPKFSGDQATVWAGYLTLLGTFFGGGMIAYQVRAANQRHRETLKAPALELATRIEVELDVLISATHIAKKSMTKEQRENTNFMRDFVANNIATNKLPTYQEHFPLLGVELTHLLTKLSQVVDVLDKFSLLSDAEHIANNLDALRIEAQLAKALVKESRK